MELYRLTGEPLRNTSNSSSQLTKWRIGIFNLHGAWLALQPLRKWSNGARNFLALGRPWFFVERGGRPAVYPGQPMVFV